MLKDFTKQGIRLASASGASDDPFYQKIAGLLAWNESRTLSIRVSASKMKRHETGRWNGKPVFSYSIARHPEGGVYLVPNDQGALVAEMFRRYAGGKVSLMGLRGYLAEAGIPKSRYAISYILKNRVYLGEVPHGKVSKSQFKPKDALTWSKGLHQPLTDQDTFDRVQALLTDNKSRQRGGPTAKYLFSGLIFCSGCGARFQARTFKRRATKPVLTTVATGSITESESANLPLSWKIASGPRSAPHWRSY
jgi:site-specific DNA recombinase